MTRDSARHLPNIVYILADDLGFGDIGCNNLESKIPTPNLDQLASEGARFTDAHAPTSVCTPSRYAILTGRYCWRSRLKTGVLWEYDPPLIEPGRLTVGRLLQQHGYLTACIGKWHLGWNWQTNDGRPANEGAQYGVNNVKLRHELGRNIDFAQPMSGGPLDCGFDYYFGDDVPNFPPYTWIENDRVQVQPTENKPDEMFGHPGPMAPGWSLEAVMPELTRRAVQYIEKFDGTPFFLYFPLTAPHTPIAPSEDFLGRSGAGRYGDFVCEVDWAVGEVMKALEREGLTGNTLLIFTSDNGPENSAYQRIQEFGHYSMGQLRGLKRDAWEGGHKVPFFARWPRHIKAGAVSGEPICLSDLMATAAAIIGAELPDDAGEDSCNILPALLGERHSGPLREATVHHSMSGKFAIRQGDWVLIDAPCGGDNAEPEWLKRQRGYEPHSSPGELFHLREDPQERRNLYDVHPRKAEQMKSLLEKYKKEGRSVTK